MDEQEIKKQVRKLMYANLREGHSKFLKKDYCYIQPSPEKYPFQWYWDTFFHVYILCALKEFDLAKKNLHSLFAMQKENGFVGHMIYWKSLLPPSIWQLLESRPTLQQFRPHMSAMIQPTFAAQTLERIYHDTLDESYLKKMLPKIQRYHEWLIVERCFEDNGLIFIISPFESGIDEKPAYDPLIGSHPKRGTFRQWLQLMRIESGNFLRRYHIPRIYRTGKFIAKDVGMNTIYALDLFALSRLCKQTGNEVDALRFDSLGHKVSGSILKLMYQEDDHAFYDLAGHENKQLRSLSFSIFFPIVLPDTPAGVSKKIIEKHLFNKDEFDLPFPIPSLAKSEKIFNPSEADSLFFDFLWRGPTWPMQNWFLYKWLLTNGYKEFAEKLLLSLKKLIELSGFREYYNPFTGKGYGAKKFTWPGLVVDMMQTRDEYS
jgi:glycogen debranching enzyme